MVLRPAEPLPLLVPLLLVVVEPCAVVVLAGVVVVVAGAGVGRGPGVGQPPHRGVTRGPARGARHWPLGQPIKILSHIFNETEEYTPDNFSQ